MVARVLIIAGSDSGGGAGLQADIKTVTALGGYAMTAVTAITVQNTKGVFAVHAVPRDVITGQIDAVLRDIGADVIKIGMIGTEEAACAILDALAPYTDIPIVLDPVLVATSGDALGDAGMADILRDQFVPRATVVTPNGPELAALTGREVEKSQDLVDGARDLLALGAKSVLAKAGHISGDPITDYFVDNSQAVHISHPRLESRHTHGTGCTLASALAVSLAQGRDPADAARRAVAYVSAAIAAAPGLGEGHGPLQHGLSERNGEFRPLLDRPQYTGSPITLRAERDEDQQAIRELTEAAFRNVPHSDGREPVIVDALRAAGDLTLSLVAVAADEVIGHIAFSPVTVGTSGDRKLVGLGPVSVSPTWQRQGVGSRLINQGIGFVAGWGAEAVVLLGDPEYYRRFGFLSGGLTYQGIDTQYVQGLTLVGSRPEGEISYAPAFEQAGKS